MKSMDLTGHVYGRLTVLARGGGKKRPSGRVDATWICQCECGRMHEVSSKSVRNGTTRSCGCLMRDLLAERNTVHGHSRRSNTTPEYLTWTGMNRRCRHDPDYINVQVCGRWATNFEAFLSDMGPKPGPNYSLDRIDSSGHYEPDNCRWIPMESQSANRRNIRWTSWEGEKISVGALAKRLGIRRTNLYYMLDRGHTLENAVSYWLSRKEAKTGQD